MTCARENVLLFTQIVVRVYLSVWKYNINSTEEWYGRQEHNGVDTLPEPVEGL